MMPTTTTTGIERNPGDLSGGSGFAELLPGPDMRPLVHVNLALSANGKSTADQRTDAALSCAQDWSRVHVLRERYGAVVVGARTWLVDAPRLTAREEHLGHRPKRQPDRVIFAGNTACPVKLDERRTFVVGALPQPKGIIHIDSHCHGLKQPLTELRRQGVESLLVEGGLTLLRSFVRERCVDRLTVYVRSRNPRLAVDAVLLALPEMAGTQLRSEAFGAGVLLSRDCGAA